VEKKEALFSFDGKEIKLVDLPGTYPVLGQTIKSPPPPRSFHQAGISSDAGLMCAGAARRHL
jgi:hypothetical protein